MRFNLLLSESILLCYKHTKTISCDHDDQYLIIKDAVFGYLPSFKNLYPASGDWCPISDFTKGSQDCKISVMKNISQKCSGIRSCKVEYIHSQYLQKHHLSCPDIENNYHILTLYVNYECVPKDILYLDLSFNNIHFVGGYIASPGYIAQKSNNHDDFKDTLNHFRTNHMLPQKSSFRPKTLLENLHSLPIVFQFQILENTLYSNPTSSAASSEQTCRMGEPYLQDYYAFIPWNKTSANQANSTSFIICPSSRNMVGEISEPIISERMNVAINMNLSYSFNIRKVLLIKFTTIFCPPLFVLNAKIVYDFKIRKSPILEVIGFAKIQCNPGYHFISSSIDFRNEYSDCMHDTGKWNKDVSSLKCVSNNEINSTTQVTSSLPVIATSITLMVSTEAPMTPLFLSTNESQIPIVMTTERRRASLNSLTKYILSCLSILVLVLSVFGYILYRKKCKLKCLSSDCTVLRKVFIKSENSLASHDISANHLNNIIIYRQAMDNGTLISGSLSYLGHGLQSNGSCRRSNRTLITRVSSRPTIGSRDSYPVSTNASDFEINQIHNGDELPTKIPKQSPIMRILRSASSLRNHSLNAFRPMSLSRQSFNDRSLNMSDSRFSGSQVPLLRGRRNNINSEFLEIPAIMWTSDISPSQTNQQHTTGRMPNFSDINLLSKSDISSKFNSKVFSPTVDTYLEPTVELSNQLDEEDSFQLSSQNGRKKSEDYMIYDHSRISSNNIDSTSPSSVTESVSDINPHEDENKRFSMISNSYYGLQSTDVKPRYYPPRINRTLPEIRNINSHNLDEPVYESIDDEPVCQSTLERREIALPLLPIDD